MRWLYSVNYEDFHKEKEEKNTISKLPPSTSLGTRKEQKERVPKGRTAFYQAMVGSGALVTLE